MGPPCVTNLIEGFSFSGSRLKVEHVQDDPCPDVISGFWCPIVQRDMRIALRYPLLDEHRVLDPVKGHEVKFREENYLPQKILHRSATQSLIFLTSLSCVKNVFIEDPG